MIFETRVGFEDAAEDQPDALGGGFYGESPAGGQQRRELVQVILVIGVDDSAMRYRRMNVDRHVERLRPLKNGPEALVVDEQTLGEAVNHRAFHIEPSHTAFELVGRGYRIDGREGSECGEALRIRAHGLVQTIVRALRERDGDLRVHEVHSRRAVRQHLNVDAGFIHFADALRAEILEPGAQRRSLFGFAVMRGDLGVEVVLLDRDDLWFYFH